MDLSVARKMLKGRVVEVFEDPITRLKSEGTATIVNVTFYDAGAGSDYGLARCMVRFMDEATPYLRTIRFPLPGEES